MKHTTAQSTAKREYDSLIDREVALIHYFKLAGNAYGIKCAKQRLQQWYRLQAEQEGKK